LGHSAAARAANEQVHVKLRAEDVEISILADAHRVSRRSGAGSSSTTRKDNSKRQRDGDNSE
jgi:hypothetical protein